MGRNGLKHLKKIKYNLIVWIRGPYEEVYKKSNEFKKFIIPRKESEIKIIKKQYAWYRYEQALQAFKDHVEKYSRPSKKSRRGGMKRRRKTRR